MQVRLVLCCLAAASAQEACASQQEHFLWPTVAPGHRTEVSGIEKPSDKPISLETLSVSPAVFLVSNFFTVSEADALIRQANIKGLAVSNTTGHALSPAASLYSIRTSKTAFDEDSVVSIAIQRRAFQLLRLEAPRELGGMKESRASADGLQILRYNVHEAYAAHHDYMGHGDGRGAQVAEGSGVFNWDTSAGGSDRFATLLLYLSDVEEGGQTVFPRAEPLDAGIFPELTSVGGSGAAAGLGTSSFEAALARQCSTRLAIPARKGSAILFYSQLPGGKLDPLSEHGACPVLKGQKWAANLWVWSGQTFMDWRRQKAVEVNVTFVNELPATVSIYWEGEGGESMAKGVLVGKVDAGGQFVMGTSHGHCFTIKEDENENETRYPFEVDRDKDGAEYKVFIKTSGLVLQDRKYRVERGRK